MDRLSTEDKETLDQALSELSSLRRTAKAVNQEYQDKEDTFDKEVEELIEFIDKVESSINNLEERIRLYAKEVYEINPEQGKDIYRGIKERDIKIVEYQEVEALAWCIEHQMFLKFDREALNTYISNMKEEYRPSFANVYTKCTITLPVNIEEIKR